jgi:alkylresorcinol/alkylpyrone synthase
MSYLYNLSCVLPEHKNTQEQLALYMQEQYGFNEEEKKRLRTMYARSGIEYRYSCISDFSEATSSKELFIGDEEPSVSNRMELFFRKGLPILAQAAKQSCDDPNQITHLITVSCTGMAAPGLDLLLCKELNLPLEINRSSVNFMGCYAFFHALKIADAYCIANPNAHVLVAGIELCTLHFNKINTTDQLAANLLFGDGAAACLVSAQKPSHNKYFEINQFYSAIIPKGEQDMAWRIDEKGFLMTLSAYIPQLIEEGISTIVGKALETSGLSKDNIIHWAFHPGGRKILDKLVSELALENNLPQASYEVLKQVGNLSSVTLVFVLNQLLTQDSYSPKQTTFAAGFGPGLTIETMVLNK